MHSPKHAPRLLFLAFLAFPQTLLPNGPPGLQNQSPTPIDQDHSIDFPNLPSEPSTRPPLTYEGFRQSVELENQSRSTREKYIKASNKGLSLLVQSAANYPKHRQCFSCHHQTLPLFAMHIAGRGVLHDSFQKEGLAIEELSFNSLRNDLKNTRTDEELDGRGLTLGYGMWLMDLSRKLQTEDKTALIRKAIATQQPQGHWRIHSHRPPAAASDAIATALVISSFVKHANDLDLTDQDRQAMHHAIFRAMVWYLRQTEPMTTEDACGMLWLGSAFRNYVQLDRKTAARSIENSVSPWALQSPFPQSPFQGTSNGILQLEGNGPPGLLSSQNAQKLREFDSRDLELFRASRLPANPQSKPAGRQSQLKGLASMVGLANSNLMLNKYVPPDTGELHLAKSPSWRTWLKENYSDEEIIRLFQAERRRGLQDTGRKLIDLQHSDGGWGQAPNQESDPYSTGMSLIVLREVYSDFRNYGGDNAWELQRFITNRYVRRTPMAHTEDHLANLRQPLPSYPFFEFEHRALKYLIKTQKQDGSWHVSSRATPVQEFFDNGDPHETDQFISIMATAWATAALANAWIGQPAPLSY